MYLFCNLIVFYLLLSRISRKKRTYTGGTIDPGGAVMYHLTFPSADLATKSVAQVRSSSQYYPEICFTMFPSASVATVGVPQVISA